MAATLTWVFVEALFLTHFGATPGKALFKTQVRSADLTPITYARALERSLRVWIYGMALGLPLIPLFTMMKGQESLVERRTTRWDTEGNFVVHHETIGMARVLIAIAVFTVLFLLIGILRASRNAF